MPGTSCLSDDWSQLKFDGNGNAYSVLNDERRQACPQSSLEAKHGKHNLNEGGPARNRVYLQIVQSRAPHGLRRYQCVRQKTWANIMLLLQSGILVYTWILFYANTTCNHQSTFSIIHPA